MTKDEALKLALEVLEEPHPGIRTGLSDALTYREKIKTAVTKIKEALAQPEPRSEAEEIQKLRVSRDKWIDDWSEVCNENQVLINKIKTALAQWTCLTDTQIHKVNEDFEQDHGSLEHTRAIEAKLKELNQ